MQFKQIYLNKGEMKNGIYKLYNGECFSTNTSTICYRGYFKENRTHSDKYIPVILLPLGIVGAVALMGFSAESVIQGILVTGATVLTNQVVKQSSKVE